MKMIDYVANNIRHWLTTEPDDLEEVSEISSVFEKRSMTVKYKGKERKIKTLRVIVIKIPD